MGSKPKDESDYSSVQKRESLVEMLLQQRISDFPSIAILAAWEFQTILCSGNAPKYGREILIAVELWVVA